MAGVTVEPAQETADETGLAAGGQDVPTGIYQRLLRLRAEIVKFASVGAVGVLSDILTFNVLEFAGVSAVPASVMSTVAATVVAYLGNRYWVFRRRRQRQQTSQVVMFAVMSTIGLGIETGCVALSHDVLGFHQQIADNIAKYCFGLAIAGIFRFWASHRWVFPER